MAQALARLRLRQEWDAMEAADDADRLDAIDDAANGDWMAMEAAPIRVSELD